jgi:hypothetical protein
MSNLFITDIIGTGDFAVPATDAALATATLELDALLATLGPALKYERVVAWVETRDGGGASRTLNCLLDRFTYDSGGGDEECPSEAEVDSITSTIEATLEADADITSIGQQQLHLQQMPQFYWSKDLSTGLLYPTITTDDIVVGATSQQGKWFQDGDLVLGTNAMSGTEVLRVVGSERVEGGTLMTEAAAVPLSPGAGEGAFWVENTAPNLPKFTDETPTDFTLQYPSTTDLSLPSIQQILFVDKTSGTYTADGSHQQPYNSVQSAINAAVAAGASNSNRYGIYIYPGVYEEALTISNQGIYLIGADRETTIIQVDDGSSDILSTNVAHIGFSDLTFRVAGTATGNVYQHKTATGFYDPIIFRNCDFKLRGGSTYFYTQRRAFLRMWNCRWFNTDSAAYSVYLVPSTDGAGEFHSCYVEGVTRSFGFYSRWYGCYLHSTTTASDRGTIRKKDTPTMELFGCFIENTASSGNGVAIHHRSGGHNLRAYGCDIRGCATASFDWSSTANANHAVSGCRFRHGMQRYVIIPGPFRRCGGADGDFDYYADIEEAKRSCTTANKVIVLLSDQTITANLGLGGSNVNVIFDGQGEHAIIRTGGIIYGTTASSDVTFRNIRLDGEIDVDSETNNIVRFENVDLEGRLNYEGTSTTQVYIHDSKLVGQAVRSWRPIMIGATGSALELGKIVLSHSYVFGDTGQGAVYFANTGLAEPDQTEFDGLEMEYTKMFHGDLGTNNPFENIVGPDYPATGWTYKAHHCVFNQEPALADPTHIFNDIDSAQRFNTIDPDGNFYWIP